jgi:uracil-DNA glycosylase family 4
MGQKISAELAAAVSARVGYYRDLGVFDFYRRGEAAAEPVEYVTDTVTEMISATAKVAIAESGPEPATEAETTIPLKAVLPPVISDFSFIASEGVPPGERAAALEAIRLDIGDCTRCPLAFQGRHKIVFGDGDANARLLFVGEGPGADEDAQGLPFVGRAGHLLNNMINAMGLQRSEVYIANIVKCRPPGNRTPEPVEANTCSQFLFRQIDVVRPEIIVALGATAATYLLGGKSSLASLRGRIHQARGSRLIVTYHPAYLLRDPRQKKEAWADLQIAMKELGLKATKRPEA